jgi:cell division protein FtsZ
MMFEFAEEIERLADIKVVGVGGAGGNAVGRMIEAGLTGVEFLAINTDLQALKESLAHNAMQIGAQLTKGLGSGGLPATGRAAAQEDNDTIASALQGADMVFVTAGMGGGTGTGAAPVIAEIARAQGALTVGIVTKPFLFEGRVRLQQAIDGIDRLRESVDTLIVIPNQRLLEVVPPSTSMQEAFRIADNVLYEATRGIYEIISRHDHVNLDFADVRSVMTGMGEAMMGTGRAEGADRAVEAARQAISSPLLEEVDIAGSQAVLVNVLGKEVGLQDTAAAMQFIQEAAGPQAHVIFGYGNDESLGETLQITVIATGFQANEQIVPEFAGARVVPEAFVAPVAAEESVPEAEEPVAEEMIVEEMTVEEVALDERPQEQEATPDPEPELEPVWNREEEPAEGSARELDYDQSFEQLDSEFPELPSEPPSESAVAQAALAGSSAPGEASELGFLTRAAAGGGADVELGFDSNSERDSAPEPEHQQRFLRPAGRRLIGEVEVPEKFSDPEPVSRSTASGLGPDHLGGDLSTPAYTRKYMD